MQAIQKLRSWWKGDQPGAEAENQYGLSCIVEGVDPVVDIVAIHGLNGHYKNTWTAANEIFWLQDLLPETIPNARIFSYGYNAATHSSNAISQQTIHHHAVDFVGDLVRVRKITRTIRRPIIFIAHSLGGIVVKSALIHANDANAAHLRDHQSIKLSTAGILFFGTPQQGTHGPDLAAIAVNLLSVFMHTDTGILKNLQRDSEWLQQQCEQYLPISRDFETKSFYETNRTPVIGNGSKLIVPRSSAVLPGAVDVEPIAINSDHIHMVKFSSAQDNGYKKVSDTIFLLVGDAPLIVENAWRKADHISNFDLSHVESSYDVETSLGYTRNEHFTGRQKILTDLHTLLMGNYGELFNARTVVVIYGLAGVGKTQVASEYAHSYRGSFSSIFWVNAKDVQSTQISFLAIAKSLINHHANRWKSPQPNYLRIAEHLKMPGLIDAEGNVTAKSEEEIDRLLKCVLHWFERTDNKGWLLIVDDVNDLENFKPLEVFPSSNSGKIIVTSCRKESSRLGKAIELVGMDEAEAIDLLSKSSGIEISQETSESYEEAKKIVRELGYLPLAIDQAGAYLSIQSLPLHTYLPLLEDMKAAFCEKPPDSVWQYRKGTVFTTWEITFRALEEENPEAAELLLMCSFLYNDDIIDEMLACGLHALNPEGLPIQKLVGSLFSYSLATRQDSSDSFSIHTLVHAWARERLDINKKREVLKKASAVLACTLNVSNSRDVLDWVYERRIALHVNSCSSWASNLLYLDSDVGYLEYTAEATFGLFYKHQGMYNHAYTWCKRALHGCETKWGVNHSNTLVCLNNLGSILRDLGMYEEAEKIQRQAVSGMEKVLGRENSETLGALCNLALLLRVRGRLSEAEAILRNGVAVMEKLKQPDHMILHAVNNLAAVLQEQGKYEEAEKLHRRVWKGWKSEYGLVHPLTLTSLNNLAATMHSQGKLEGAEEGHRIALAGCQQILGEHHPNTLRSINNLATVLNDKKDYGEAEKQNRKALEGYTSLYGLNHPSVFTSLDNLAGVLFSQGKHEEVESTHRQSLQGREQILGPEHPDTLRSISLLAQNFYHQKKYKDAEELYRRALVARENNLRVGNPDTIMSLRNLSSTLLEMGEYGKAEEIHELLLVKWEKELGPEHTSILEIVHSLGYALLAAKRYDKAAENFHRAGKGRIEVLGLEHPDTRESMAGFILATKKIDPNQAPGESRSNSYPKH